MVVGLSACLQFLTLSTSPCHRAAPPLRHLATDLPTFDRLLHPPAVRFLLHHFRADPPLHGGGSPYDPETHDVPELPGREGPAQLVPRLHGLLQRELRAERLVGLRDWRVPGGGGIIVDVDCIDIYE